MTSESEIVSFKTTAWADPGMVGWYAQRVVENVGDNRLKNRVETHLIRTLARGHDILDVGIGSGRASLPLLETGIALTGIDSSQAMLDECRRRAGGRPIRLEHGDITAIPYADESFDTLVSLNVMTHFPNWREVLPEWLRVLRPGGRMVFDIYSLDHIEAVAARRGPGLEHLLPGGLDQLQANEFQMRIKVSELAEFALAAGVRLTAIHPYLGSLGSESNFWTCEGWAKGRSWDRLKSWIADDERLFEFFLFLELEGYLHLDSTSSARFMVVIEKSADEGETERVLARQAAVASALAAPVLRLSDLAPFLGMPLAEWRATFNRHLDHPLNRLALFQLLSAGLDAGLQPELADWLEPRHVELFDRWLLAWEMDKQLYGLASGWYRAEIYEGLLEYKGVPLGPGLEYQTLQTLVRAALHNNPLDDGEHA